MLCSIPNAVNPSTTSPQLLYAVSVFANLTGAANDFSYTTLTRCSVLVMDSALYSQIAKRTSSALLQHFMQKLKHRCHICIFSIVCPHLRTPVASPPLTLANNVGAEWLNHHCERCFSP